MKISQRSTFWLITVLILFAGFIGGILGNWIFIYLLDKYYGIAAGNYLVAPNAGTIVVRQGPKNNVINPVFSVADAESSLSGIFKRVPGDSPFYLPKDKLGQAITVTADGWLATVTDIPVDKNGQWSDMVVVANDRRVYSIDRVLTGAAGKFNFIHIAKADKLTVRDFILSQDLLIGQELYGLEWQGVVERGILSHQSLGHRSSEEASLELSVSGIGERNIALFDGNGRIAGISRGHVVIAMDSVKAMLAKLLTDNKINRARLGIYYVNVDKGNAAAAGALIGNGSSAAIVKGSPADKSGLRAGDRIISLDGVAVGPSVDLSGLLEEYTPGDSLHIKFIRQNETKEVTVVLDEVPKK